MKREETTALRAKWVRWLEKLEPIVLGLYRDRVIVRRLDQIVQANAILRGPNPFTRLVFANYDRAAALTIRQLLDADRRTISLRRLANSIAARPNLITREEYIHLRTRDLCKQDQAAGKDHANADFDTFAYAKGKHVSPAILKTALEETLNKTKDVRKAVSEVVAHYQHNAASDLTLGDLDDAIDAVGALFQRLSLLLKGMPQTPPERLLMQSWDSVYGDWESIFREPWIEPD